MNVLITDERASHQFAVAEATFERVLRKHPEVVYQACFLFGGHTVQIRIVGSDLATHILLPFHHLRTNGPSKTNPKLTIDLWDETTTKIRRQPESTLPDHGWYAYTESSPQDRFFTQRSPNTFSCLDRKANRIIGSIAWSEKIFVYERAKPLSRVLLEWHNDQQIQVIHGGLVSRNGQGVLFVGKSGSGKSTSSLACFSGGLQFIAEDFIGLERRQDGTFWGHSLYNSVFLETDHLRRFPNLQPFILSNGNPHDKKSALILAQISPNLLERVAPIRVLVLAHVGNAPEARIRPASKAEALLALGPSSLFQIPSRGKSAFSKLTELAESIPTYWLEIGENLGSIPPCVEKLLATLPSD